jgi:hypothetical protein
MLAMPALARPSGVEVTRFHDGAALAGQDVAVVAADPAVGASLAFAGVAGPVAAELARAGMPPAAAGATPALTATIRYDSRAFEEPRKTQFSIGLGAGSFGRRGGFGVGGNMPVGSRTRSVAEITLAVQIRRTADNRAVWEGRATDVLSADQAGRAPARLAAALFAGFPGTNGETLRVKKVPAPAPALSAPALSAPALSAPALSAPALSAPALSAPALPAASGLPPQ